MTPNNATDLIQSIRDGEVGVIDQILIGDMVVSAMFGLDAPETLSLTNRKIQSGADIATMAIDDRTVITMDICLANPEISLDAAITAAATGDIGVMSETWRDKRDELRQMKTERQVIDVQTHDNLYPSFLITGIYPIFDSEENWDAFICSVVLEKVRIYGDEETETGTIAMSKEVVSGL